MCKRERIHLNRAEHARLAQFHVIAAAVRTAIKK